jgi:hypothetical protein
VLAQPVLSDLDTTAMYATMQFTAPGAPGFEGVRNRADLRHYFEYSAQGIELLEDGLQEISFGEFLVDQGVLDRFQLFRALQMQDRLPGVRLGEAAAALGYAPIGAIERMFTRFQQLHVIDVE